MPKQYLGDSVYAEINDNGEFVLTTENGAEPSNTIYLEPSVIYALITFIKQECPEFLEN